eukprot:TRINITY_DN48230_c0_g1_i1.p1 TRINITY_DN48230_c0_g1~~TRINITY_DN48230_c0_g1_i1.p1  ORF type:complete len:575 (+),score=113.85 TRINITY_DN48230_c0_g1_i1:170-1726(+)
MPLLGTVIVVLLAATAKPCLPSSVHHALAAVATHLLAPAWLLLAAAIADPQLQLLAGVFLAESLALPCWASGLCILCWMCCLSWHDLVQHSWGPALVLLLRRSQTTVAAPVLAPAKTQEVDKCEATSKPAPLAPEALQEAVTALDGPGELQLVQQAVVPALCLEALAQELLAAEWNEGSFVRDLYRIQGGTEICPGSWADVSGSGSSSASQKEHVREVQMRVPCPPAPGCPASTRMTVTVRVSTAPSDGSQLESIMLDVLAHSHDIPFGSSLRVQERIELRTMAGTSDTVEVKKFFRCNFVSSVGFIAPIIRAHTGVEQAKSFPALVSTLKSRADPQAEAKTDDHSMQTVQLWELERRVSMVHSEWHSPFLPYDSQKRWRWVDRSYEMHAWMRPADEEAAATAKTPPVTPQEKGWIPINEWSVSYGTAEGTRDEDGWQYAMGFFHDDWWWSADSCGHVVRRRLWTRSFKKVGSAQCKLGASASQEAKYGKAFQSKHAVCVGAAASIMFAAWAVKAEIL